MQLPAITVIFDGGATVEVQPRSRDLLALERQGMDLADMKPMESMYASAYAALQRLDRNHALPEGVSLPESLDGFMDLADIEPEDVDEGEGTGQVAITGA